ncbi:hypothetical protein P7K49_035826 [Saguinus oedipus]|uniref:Uncharacterized protein n=1 Tax=Saguinus oedipus TaxID=9490 RepID=A0ABQ9TNQ7_SAGOE|nr:hypothetical protein P7K49_035826 [Saguinus oedipus]
MRLVHETRNHLRLVGCSVAACNTEAQGVQESLSKVGTAEFQVLRGCRLGCLLPVSSPPQHFPTQPHKRWLLLADQSMASLQILEELSHQLLQDRAKAALASSPPISPHPSPTPKDLLLQ